jgi:cysteine sulfinate desulfinase/cysteine desulfurase-like protein
MGVPDDVLRSAMRFSLSPLLSADEVDEAAQRIAHVVNSLRARRPSAPTAHAPIPSPSSPQ